MSRNHQGSREDLHSAESRDSRISTHANSQSSSVYDNVQKVFASHPKPSSVLSCLLLQESQQRRHEFGSVRERRSGRSSSRNGGHHDSASSGRSAYSRSRHAASGTGSLKLKKDLLSKSVDYSDMDTVREGEKGVTRKQRSKSIDHLNASQVQSQF